MSAVVRGPRAALRAKDRQPEFRDLAGAVGTAPSGSWILAKVDVRANERTVQRGTAAVSLLGGSKTRNAPRDVQVVALDYGVASLSCDIRGTALAIFTARPQQPLAPANTCCFRRIRALLFDFGVQ